MKNQNIDHGLLEKISALYHKHTDLRKRCVKKFVKEYLNLFVSNPKPETIFTGLIYCLADAARSKDPKNISFVEAATREFFDQIGDHNGNMPITMIVYFIRVGPEGLLLFLPMILICTPVIGIIETHFDKDFDVTRLSTIALSDIKTSDKRFLLEWATRGIWESAISVANQLEKKKRRRK